MKGKLIYDKYLILKTLGRNAFSETYLAKDSGWLSPRRYIIKKLRPILGNAEANAMRRLFYQEASILQRLSGKNPQIPRLYAYFLDGEDFYIVREWISGLTLKQKVEQEGALPSTEVERILNSILSFLKYIHSYGIVYRQLKPSTIILRQCSLRPRSQLNCLPVPIYFGGVKELELKNDDLKQYKSSLALVHQPEYISPEQKQGQSVFASDLYSLGLTAIYLLTGKNPTEFPLDRYTKKPLWHQDIPKLKIHLVRVIDRAIYPDMNDRYSSAEEMLNSLNSPPINLAPPEIEPESKKSQFSLEVKMAFVLSLLSIGVITITFIILNNDFSLFAKGKNKELVQTLPTDRSLTDTLIPIPTSPDQQPKATNKIPPFPLGMKQQQIIDLLGEPTSNLKGYWQDTRALLYQDIVPKQISLGYLTDNQTTKVRQAEISFAPSVDFLTVKQQIKHLLQDNYSQGIDDDLNQIYFHTSDLHSFEINNIKGIIQRNPEEHIYIGIWDRQFH